MTKKEVVKELHKKLTQAIKSLPDDIEFQSVSLFKDATIQFERDREAGFGVYTPSCEGARHIIELTVEEVRQ